jgi:hypothetical protein
LRALAGNRFHAVPAIVIRTPAIVRPLTAVRDELIVPFAGQRMTALALRLLSRRAPTPGATYQSKIWKHRFRRGKSDVTLTWSSPVLDA